MLVNAWVATHSEQTNAVGKDLTWEDKYWGKHQKAWPQGPPSGPSPATPTQERNAGAVAGINACINAMNFSPPVKVLLRWRRPVQRLVVLAHLVFLLFLCKKYMLCPFEAWLADSISQLGC